MKKVLLGMAIGMLLTVSTAVYASDGIQALIFPVKIKINGQEKQLMDDYQILNVDGHAYVPIRYVAENVGINVGYDDVNQTILLAYGTTFTQDKNETNVSIGDLILTTDKYKDTTKVTGHIALTNKEPSYVDATLEFYDSQNNLVGNVFIENDFQSDLNNFETRGNGDLTTYSSVVLKVIDVHPSMKLAINSLLDAAKVQDQKSIKQIIAKIPEDQLSIMLLDFIKVANDDSNLREYILPSILERNINLNIQDKRTGYTPLMYASQGFGNLVQPLIEARADVNIKAKDGTTALTLFASKGKPELVKLFLDKGANPNGVGINGYTPLLSALRPLFGHYTGDTVKIVSYLLEAGANVDVKLPEGITPLMIAKDISEPDIAAEIKSMLTEHGAK